MCLALVYILAPQTQRHFTTNGRIGYDIIADYVSGAISKDLTWEGVVSDFIAYDDKFCFAYSVIEGDTTNKSYLIEYDTDEDEYTKIYTHDTRREQILKMVKNETNYYLLISENGEPQERRGKIIVAPRGTNEVIDTSDVHTIVTSTAELQPQVYRFYAVGNKIYNQPPRKKLFADLQSDMVYYNDNIYYAYKTTSGAGIAKISSTIPDPVGSPPPAPSKVIEFEDDERGNNAGISFDVDPTSGILFGAATFQTTTQSVLSAFKKSI